MCRALWLRVRSQDLEFRVKDLGLGVMGIRAREEGVPGVCVCVCLCVCVSCRVFVFVLSIFLSLYISLSSLLQPMKVMGNTCMYAHMYPPPHMTHMRSR